MAYYPPTWPSVAQFWEALKLLAPDHPRIARYAIRLRFHGPAPAVECGRVVPRATGVELWARDPAKHPRPMDADHLAIGIGDHKMKNSDQTNAVAAAGGPLPVDLAHPLLMMILPSRWWPGGIAKAVAARWMAADEDQQILTFAPLEHLEN